MDSLICAWINGWVNNRDAGDLRRHRNHYDVTNTSIHYTATVFRRVILGQSRGRKFNSSTPWGRDKIPAISQTTFSKAFSSMRMFKCQLKFHWSWFPRAQLIIFQHWSRQWLGVEQSTYHYLNQCCPRLPAHICVTRPQRVKWNCVRS